MTAKTIKPSPSRIYATGIPVSPIYRTFWGSYIDLSRLVEVSSAILGHRAGSLTSHVVAFTMTFQLMEKPIVYERTAGRKLGDTTPRDEVYSAQIAALQKQVDEIVAAWKAYVESSPQGSPQL